MLKKPASRKQAIRTAQIILFLLIAYTLYLMQNFPDFAHSTAYAGLHLDASDSATTTMPTADSGRPSWVSNINILGNVRGDGYQSLDV